MKKLHQLRQHLLQSPLRIDPDKLLTYADKGALVSYPGDHNRHFEMRYTAHVILEGHGGPLDAVLFLLDQWLQANQQAQPEGRRLEFSADILDHASADLEFAIPLSETVKAKTLDNGDIQLHHCGEPDLDPLVLPGGDWATYLNADPGDPDATPWLTWTGNGD